MKKELDDLEQAFKSRKIKNLDKNDYHLRYIRDDKSYLDTVYCFTSLAGKTIRQPDHVKVTIRGEGGNLISVEKETDVPVAVSKDSISKTLDCPFIYINFEPADSNLLIQDYLYCVKTIQFNPQYHLPGHGYSTPTEIYREYTSSRD